MSPGSPFPDDRGLVAPPGVLALQVSVEAVVGDVQLAADEPLRSRGLPLQHLLPGGEPADVLLGHLGPEAFGLLAPSLRNSSTVRLFQLALFLNSGLGLKVRFSFNRDSMSAMPLHPPDRVLGVQSIASGSAIRDERLYVFRICRDGFRQVLATVFGDRDVVFDADADASELRVRFLVVSSAT